jgi:hypothetical protein
VVVVVVVMENTEMALVVTAGPLIGVAVVLVAQTPQRDMVPVVVVDALVEHLLPVALGLKVL